MRASTCIDALTWSCFAPPLAVVLPLSGSLIRPIHTLCYSRSIRMTTAVLLASSTLAVVLVLALVREVRLRRALQNLIRRLLEKWRLLHDD